MATAEAKSAPISGWVERMAAWSELVDRYALAGSGRYQADALTRMASDNQVRLALLFMMASLVAGVRALPEPASRVVHLVNLPEAILQTLAAGFCEEIDFSKPPTTPPNANYAAYFGAPGAFEFPRADQKMTLGLLLVIVPAILASRIPQLPAPFSSAAAIRPLQQTLVDRLRNPASHTIAAFAEGDAAFLCALCQEWLEAWAVMEGFSAAAEVPGIVDAPTGDYLSELLLGEPAALSPDAS